MTATSHLLPDSNCLPQPKIGVLALGTMGITTCVEIHERLFISGVHWAGVSFSAHELSNVPIESRIVVGSGSLGFIDGGRESFLAIAANNHIDIIKLIKFCDQFDEVILIGGLSGEQTSALIQILTSELMVQKVKVSGCYSLPRRFEGQKRMSSALEAYIRTTQRSAESLAIPADDEPDDDIDVIFERMRANLAQSLLEMIQRRTRSWFDQSSHTIPFKFKLPH